MTRGRWLVAAATGLLLAACTIEPRADTRSAASTAESTAGDTTGSVADASVTEVLAALDEALRVGDAARVASLGAEGVMLIDHEAGIVWTETPPAPRLPEALTAPRSDLTWTLDRRRVSAVGDARLVVSFHRAVIAGEPVDWWAVETTFLVPEAGRWRVRYLHRSRGPLDSEGVG